MAVCLCSSAVVAVTSGTVIPYLASRDQRLLALNDQEDEDEDAETVRIRELVRAWKSEAAREGRPLKLPTMPFMLRNIWTSSLVLYAVLMASTFFIRTVVMVFFHIITDAIYQFTSPFSTGNRHVDTGWHLLGCNVLGSICHTDGGSMNVISLCSFLTRTINSI